MKRTLATLFAALAAATILIACGGADPAPIAQCNGTPKAAVIYVGDRAFPELAAVPNACVYSTHASTVPELAAVVAVARNAAGVARPYFVSTDTALVMAFRTEHPGVSEVSSVWFVPPAEAYPIPAGSLVTLSVNAPAGNTTCQAIEALLRTAGTPGTCRVSVDNFGPLDRAEALRQLHLENVL